MFRFCEREKSSSQICLLAGGIEPQTRYAAQGLTGHCDEIVTLFWGPIWLLDAALIYRRVGLAH